MRFPSRALSGFTLLELLLVIAIVGTLVGVLLPSSQPAVHEQLRSTARIVATDLAYARSLAVSNNDAYKIAFDLDANRYVLTHSGVNAALNQLPKSPFSSPGDPPDRHIVDLDDLPHVGPTVRLAAAATTGATTRSVGDVEFGVLGQTSRSDPTTIWLMAGSGDEKRYVALVVSPITGLTEIGDCSKSGPPSGITQIQ
jgi:prepilin-type N-terminal cleavage/methylation domain-containing protein